MSDAGNAPTTTTETKSSGSNPGSGKSKASGKTNKKKNKVGPSPSPKASVYFSNVVEPEEEKSNNKSGSLTFELDIPPPSRTETEVLIGGQEIVNLETVDLTKDLAQRDVISQLNTLPPEELYYGMYRHYDLLEKLEDKNFTPFPVTEAYCKFFKHPPNPLKFWFFTDGYYVTDSSKEKKKIRICNLPPDLQKLPPEIRKEKLHELFPTAEIITIENDTATMVYGSQKDAETAFKKAELVKLQGQGLAWVSLKELYILNVPANVPEREVLRDFSTAVSIKFLPGSNDTKVAILSYNTDEQVEEVYNDSKMIKLGNNQLAWYGTGSREDALLVQNIPEGLTEKDLKGVYPTAIHFSIGRQKTDKKAYHLGALATTLTATVQFDTKEETEEIFKQSKFVKIGHLTLAWTHPDELYLSGVPVGITPSDIRQIIGDIKSVKLLPQEDKRMTAVLKYADEKAADKAFRLCRLQKLGYHWLSAAEMRDTVTITCVPKYNFNMDEVRRAFPKHRNIQVAPDDEEGSDYNRVLIAFGTETMAEDGYKAVNLVKIDPDVRIIAWIKPNEISIVDPPPDLEEACLRQVYPTMKRIRTPYDQRYVFASFETAEDAEAALATSKLKEISPHRVLWDEAYSPKFEGDPEDLKTLWKIPHSQYSNISNLFSFAIELANLPPGITLPEVHQNFPSANRITPPRPGRPVAIIEFSNIDKAVAAYIKARNAVLEGRRIHPKARTFYLNETVRRQYEHEGKPGALSRPSGAAAALSRPSAAPSPSSRPSGAAPDTLSRISRVAVPVRTKADLTSQWGRQKITARPRSAPSRVSLFPRKSEGSPMFKAGVSARQSSPVVAHNPTSGGKAPVPLHPGMLPAPTTGNNARAPSVDSEPSASPHRRHH